ncbi:TonB-dependent receptor [Stenotrophomonas rhizophila]|uniref:TonB-dependent receptor n=1 Tax=Stenotrophomonas rhizophila TaxID=216778 RepID=UPI001E569BEA|nr:TonB-dependent receptor [Stenotrophomonas rhizophila]MCC7635984.1 TonB-dependent receptor [Stenotrophomonas rhizophila]MCC7665331.1 TonB-dependent receptor [Stenotrophomonas rhizophila]
MQATLRLRRWLRLGALGIALCAALPPRAEAGGTPAPIGYRIERGTLATALQHWARQSGQLLVFDAGELAGLQTAGLHTRQAPAAALDQLLAGLPVKVQQTADGVFVVRRTAPAVAAAAARTPARAVAPAAPGSAPQVQLAPVQVTGSRLPRSSLQTTLPVTLIERDEILRSGYGSLFDLLRHLPGMAGHSPLSTSGSGDSLYLPSGAAATTSLDGMGPRATLFLVNGRRLPRYPMVSLNDGALTDLGGIPLSFVERIELVRGGASAIYGADAMSGVVNIILRDHADGAEAMLQSGVSSRGDGDQQRLQLAGGGSRANGDRWFAGLDLQRAQHVGGDRRAWHREQDRYPIGLLSVDGDYLPAALCPAPLQRDDDGCWYDSARPGSLQPAASTLAAYGRYRRELGLGRYAYAEARASRNRQRFELGATAAALHLGNGLLINHVFQEGGIVRPRVQATDTDLTVGVGRNQPGRRWEAGVGRQHSEVLLVTEGAVRTEQLFAATRQGFVPGFTPLPPQQAALLFPRIGNRGRTEQWQAWWGLQRDLVALPGGAAQWAAGIDLRHETWTAQPDALLGEGKLALGLPLEQRRLSRPSSAVYTELGLPLAATLRLDVAARWDRDAGDNAFSPRAGLRWSPSAHWSWLLSSGRGYRAPSLFERRRPPADDDAVVLPPSSALPPCAQPSTQGCVLDVAVVENRNLEPETTRSYALGVTWTPASALSLSLTHNRVELRNEILALRPQDAQWNRRLWALDEAGQLQSLRLSFDNIGRTVSRNWVLRGDYRRATGADGQWQLSLDALRQQVLRRFRAHGGAVDLRGHATPRHAAVFGTQWQNPHWDIAVRANYVGRTRAWLPGQACPPLQHEQQRCSNPDRLYWNLHLGRQLGPRTALALDVHNLFDAPPVNHLVGNGGLARGRDDPLGRYFLLTLQLR